MWNRAKIDKVPTGKIPVAVFLQLRLEADTECTASSQRASSSAYGQGLPDHCPAVASTHRAIPRTSVLINSIVPSVTKYAPWISVPRKFPGKKLEQSTSQT